MSVYWVVWDAAAPWIVDRLDRDGRLPALRRLRSRGVRAAARPPAPNCQTPPSLATLFTGAPSQEHGVTGFSVPEAGSATARRSGFDHGFPGRPPVWRTLARHGRRSAFVHVPWVFDAGGGVGLDVDGAIESYSGRLSRPEALHLAGNDRASWPVGEYDVDVRAGASGAELRTAVGSFQTGPRSGWVAVRVAADTGFWVRHLVGPRGAVLARTGAWRTRVAGTNRRLLDGLAAAPLFAGKGVGPLLRAGTFGPPLAQGGNGRAEDVFLSAVEDCVAPSFAGAVDAVLATHEADIVMAYLPWTDEIGHEIVGLVDDRSGAHRPALERTIRDLLDRCYRPADAVLGRVLDRADPATDTVILTADHGMVGSTHHVHVNEQLIRAGLAGLTAGGALDPGSQVVYHPANNGSLRVNHRGLDGGVVALDDVAATMRSAMAALREIAAPGGGSVVHGFVDGDARPLADGDAAALAYLVLRDDFQPSADVGSGEVVRTAAKTGAHVVNTGSSRLHATFAAAGPGLPAGLDLGEVDTTLACELALHQLGAGDVPSMLLAAGREDR
jgi:predicted AlkP superfamily phosphohydrolase/phosphomutase